VYTVSTAVGQKASVRLKQHVTVKNQAHSLSVACLKASVSQLVETSTF